MENPSWKKILSFSARLTYGVAANIIWLILGGWIFVLCYMIQGAVLCLTIIGIPFGLCLFKIGLLAFAPFGKEITFSPEPPGCLSMGINLFYLLFGGIWNALGHALIGAVLCLTIIGIPFALQHFKLMKVAFMPLGTSWRTI